MSQKLKGNGLFESSRMMLPEHIRSFRSKQHTEKTLTRPVLDADELEIINRRIAESFEDRAPITLRMYDKYEELRVIGVVERIDPFARRICVNGDWFRMDDVLSAT